jgi:transcriptional regulator with XRE-family HTH domain
VLIRRNYKAPWSHGFVTEEGDLPELATNDEWRGIMKRARMEHGLTQAELARKVGTSQVMISNLESGAATSSKYVLRICRELEIPVPEHFADDVDRAWAQLGRVLRAKGLDKQKAATEVVRALAGITDDDLRTDGQQHPPQNDADQPKKPK